MLRSAQPSQFSTYPIQNIDIPVLAVLQTIVNIFNEKIRAQQISLEMSMIT